MISYSILFIRLYINRDNKIVLDITQRLDITKDHSYK